MRKKSKFKYFIPIISFLFYLLFSNHIVWANSIEDDFDYGDNREYEVPYYPGGVTIYGDLSTSRKDLVLPDRLGGKPVTIIGMYAFDNKQLTSLKFSDNMKSISSGAFRNNQLTSVILPNQLEWIGQSAFQNNHLSSITIPNSVKKIYGNAFIGNDLKTITIFGANTFLMQSAIPTNTKILGVSPSEAKDYADANGFVFEEIANKITYDGNGQTSGELSEDYTGNTTKTFIVKNQGSLKKIGYTFIGWNDKQDGSGTDYDVGEEIVINQDITLYAKWEEDSFLVSYETNGGTTVDTATVLYGGKVTKPANPTNMGYTFVGWYTENTFNNEWNFATDVVTGNITLYAKWSANPYTVTFETNGGTTVDTATVLYGGKITKPANPTNMGYTFVGWYTENTFNNEWNFATDVVTGNITLYAKWSANPYTVTFETNGGTTIHTETANYGEKVTKPVDPTKAGHTFEDWYKNSEFNIAWDFTTDVVTEAITLYAKWTTNTYPVTFEANGGSAIVAQQVPYNSQANEPTPPSKQGHTFVGWYKDTALTQEWNFATDIVTEAITLYAKWTTNPTYTVTYDKNGATGGTVPQDNKAYEQNDNVTVQGNSGQLVRTNYTFKGWNTQADGKGIPYVKDATFPMGQINVTLYAEWTANPPATGGGNNPSPSPVSPDHDDSPPTKVTITLQTNGGTILKPIEITYNMKIRDVPSPTREGYRFDGWYQDEALTKPLTEETIVRENSTLYAKWTALPVEEPQSPKPNITFSDVERHWAKDMIVELSTRGIIQGYEDGSFHPNAPISRMHVAVLLTRAFPLNQVREGMEFVDVPTTHPYYEAIATLQQAGIVNGSNGAFHPTENMTRAQLAKVLVGVLGLAPEGTSSFKDVDSKHWSTGYIAVLEREGITLGDNGHFRPNEPVTRAQFVAFLYRIMQK
ncbi:InlB B-repeat-containing protein [Lysinibacillus louembei]|uniref:InlB B-repeat-containing protein n=1 Tax=Lysinibacillus louembei TaxID=1470088 RepID=A0ABZ0RSH9_9BACI|nr:InlB B-repeat-containing protein [Lysinibacillus louembei]WPK10276.1 InlB B-repeat-containing protein [Lysinibacillus louembei]